MRVWVYLTTPEVLQIAIIDAYNGVTLFDFLEEPEEEKPKGEEPKEACFTLTLKLKYNRPLGKHLDKMFAAGNRLYNALVEEKKADLEALQATPEWKQMQAQLAEGYKAIDAGTMKKEDLNPIYRERKRMLDEAGFNMYAFQHAIKKHRLQFGYETGGAKPMIKSTLINSQIMNHIAMHEVWPKFDKYLYNDGKAIRFRKAEDCRSLTCPTNTQGIIFDGTCIQLSTRGVPANKNDANRKKIRNGNRQNRKEMEAGRGNPNHGKLVIPVMFTGSAYEKAALDGWEERLCYCRLVRIPWKKGWLYKVQLVLKGNPPQIDADGCIVHQIGSGRVGIDIGPKTVAVVGENDVIFVELVPRINRLNAEMNRVLQKMDQSRRSGNPEMFDADDQIVRIDVLAKNHPECVRVVGKGTRNEHFVRVWKDSKNYKRLRLKLRYLYARVARSRKCEHNELANKVVSMGNEFYIEPMNWRGLAKKAKKADPDKGEKPNKRRKRFGKSIGTKAPGKFTEILKKKAEAKGGLYKEIDSYACKASQYNHVSKDYVKPAMSDRVKIIGGECVQRDLYSAFLLQNTNKGLDGFNQEDLEAGFDEFMWLHDIAMERVPNKAPNSMGKRDWVKARN